MTSTDPLPAAGAPTFTVIIPLESDFGWAERCVRTWARHIDFPRQRYRLILAAPDDLPPSAAQALRALLGAGDSFLSHPAHHDVSLVAAAARIATDDLLFFTECHCVPRRDVLAIAEVALAAHPSWVGLTLRPERAVRNRLSELEADMFDHDFAVGMAPGHWAKIHDACFVVRRDAYLAGGGFDPALGHFAEMMLAARFHRMGLTVGYVPEGKVDHLYPGDLVRWRDFTRDFVRHEIEVVAGGAHGDVVDLFAPIPEWVSRLNWNAATARRLIRICVQDALAHGAPRPSLWLRWLPAALGDVALGRLRAEVVARLRWIDARRASRFASSSRALAAPVKRYMGALTHAERMRSVARWMAARAGQDPPAEASGAWHVRRQVGPSAAGMRPGEPCGDVPVVWSEAAALVELPLAVGLYDVSLEWVARPEIDRAASVRFYFNERAVGGARIADGGVTLRLEVIAAGTARLAWVCDRRPRPRETARRGLPLERVAWRRVERASPGAT